MSKVIVSTVLGKVDNIEAVLPGEYAKVNEMTKEGVLEHLFVKEGNTGAVLIFKGLSLSEVKARVASFPLYPSFNQIN